jgi:intron-binding protein aquarius
MLVTGELWPSDRILKEEEGETVVGESQMENVEHLGQYVYEMINAKVQQLRAERGLPEAELVDAPLGDDGFEGNGGEYLEDIEEEDMQDTFEVEGNDDETTGIV